MPRRFRFYDDPDLRILTNIGVVMALASVGFGIAHASRVQPSVVLSTGLNFGAPIGAPVGRVTAFSPTSITIATPAGKTEKYSTTLNTAYRTANGDIELSSAVRVGDTVAVTPLSKLAPTVADRVTIAALGVGFGGLSSNAIFGTVSSATSHSFKIVVGQFGATAPSSTSVTVDVNASTIYLLGTFRVAHDSGVKTGAVVAVTGSASSSTLTATEVVIFIADEDVR